MKVQILQSGTLRGLGPGSHSSTSPGSMEPRAKPKRKPKTKSAAELAKERYYLDLKCSEILKEGGKSKYVWRMSDGCIKKRYESTEQDHEDHFRREVRILRYLRTWPHSPNILWINQKKRTIYMTYCGLNPTADEFESEWKEELENLMAELREDWGVIRRNAEGQETNHIDLHNICVLNDRLHLIDFGSPLWELHV